MVRPQAPLRKVSIAVTGASGFIGTHLVAHWRAAGHRVLPVARGHPGPTADAPTWDPVARTIDAAKLDGLDAVVHLAGEPIGQRWTAKRRERILESRRAGTRFLAETLARLERPPRVLVCASAVGYYGDRGGERLTESSAPGQGFLADVCRAWESAADPARARGIRVVHLRQGLVLGRDGGALRRILLPFRLGLGGRLGDGQQYWSWIALSDLLRVYDHVVAHEQAAGPINAVAPLPVTNAEFTRVLARVLRRPAVLPVPRFALRLLYRDMADEALLYGQRVVPARLAELDFEFEYPDLETALRAELHRPGRHEYARPHPPAQPSLRGA